MNKKKEFITIYITWTQRWPNC